MDRVTRNSTVQDIFRQLGRELSIDRNAVDLKAPVYTPVNYYAQQVNRYVYTASLMRELGLTGRVLEIGVVPGHFAAGLSRLGYELWGVDIDPSRVEDFQSLDKSRLKACNVETDTLPFDDNTFDVVLCCELIEHLRINPLRMLREAGRVLKENGSLILSTPNRSRLISRIRLLKGNPDIESPYLAFKRVEDYGHAGHIRLYTFGELREMLEGANLATQKVAYFDYKSHLFADKDKHGVFKKPRFTDIIKKAARSIKPKVLFILWLKIMHAIFPSLRNRMCVIATKSLQRAV